MFPDLQGRLVGKRVTAALLPRPRRGRRRARLQLPARGRRRHDAAAGLRVRQLGRGLRRREGGARHGDAAPHPVAREDRAGRCATWSTKATATPIEVSPRQILSRQIERAAAAGYTVKIGAELEFFLFKDSYDEAAAKHYRDLTPHSDWIEDYHILQTTRDEYLIRQIRNGMDGAGVPVEFSKGEAGRGQHEINLEYADALEMADRHAIYKNGAKEIAALNGRSITFMAKWSMDEVGSSCHLHSSLWSTRRRHADGGRGCAAPLAGRAARRDAASWRGASPRTSTRTSGSSPARGRRPRWSGARTTAPARSAWSATATTGASSAACPAPTATRTSPTRRRSPPGCTASRTSSTRARPIEGNAYVAPDDVAAQCRRPWSRPSTRSRRSDIAIDAFGPAVHAPPPQHRPPGVGRVQPGRHRLGTRAGLRTPVIAITLYTGWKFVHVLLATIAVGFKSVADSVTPGSGHIIVP